MRRNKPTNQPTLELVYASIDNYYRPLTGYASIISMTRVCILSMNVEPTNRPTDYNNPSMRMRARGLITIHDVIIILCIEKEVKLFNSGLRTGRRRDKREDRNESEEEEDDVKDEWKEIRERRGRDQEEGAWERGRRRQGEGRKRDREDRREREGRGDHDRDSHSPRDKRRR